LSKITFCIVFCYDANKSIIKKQKMLIEIGNIVGGFMAGADGIRQLGLAQEAVAKGQARLAPYRKTIARLLFALAIINLLDRWFFEVPLFTGSFPQSIVALALGLILDDSIFGSASWAQSARKSLGGWETAIGIIGIIIGLAAIL
jgi:hypothetical protein